MSTFITKRQHQKLIYIHVHLYLIIFLCSYSKIYKSYLNLSLVKVNEALKSLFKVKVKVNVVKEDIIVLNLILKSLELPSQFSLLSQHFSIS